MAFKSKLTWDDVTPRSAYLNRRQIMTGAAGPGLGSIAGPLAAEVPIDREPNTFEQISSYNNFYEFGFGKEDPAKYAHALTTDPWSVEIDGLVDRPGKLDLAEILGNVDVEERIYRHRCVEAWSMVVPWNGFELRQLLEMVGVQPAAKYVAFETALRPDEMRGVRSPTIDWPYVEGLRLDEAMHPLTLMATGLYDKPMPNQNGAPIRLVVPWKYGFKGIKSIVKITLTDTQPRTTWNELQPNEYGFYANVNPEVDHPRWSQATERVIGGGFFAPRIDTLKFNGYEDEVAGLYDGMDLAKFY